MPPTPLIQVNQLGKRYESVAADIPPALDSVNLSIASGEFVAVMGPSGSGKSTFMNILGCLDIPTSGEYRLQERDVAQLGDDDLADLRNQLIGFVFQGFNLLKRMSVADNVALPLLYAGVERSERRARAVELLGKMGLSAHTDKLPNQLSGGQQQRVAIARALANRPRLILADEPTGNLDTHTSEEIMGIFTGLNRDEGITVVIVTHEADIARYAKRLVRFRDGKVVHDGAVELTTNEHE